MDGRAVRDGVPGEQRPEMAIKSKLSGNEVYYAACSLLVTREVNLKTSKF